MKEYVDKELFLAELKERHDYIMQDQEISKAMKWCEAVCFGRTKDILETLPAADVKYVIHSEWEITEVDHAHGSKCYHCPECGEDDWRYDEPNFCPNCGADMRGKSHETN